MSKRPLEDSSCCVRPSRTKFQWINKSLLNHKPWAEYVDEFLRDYDNLDATSRQAKEDFLKKYFLFGKDEGAQQLELQALRENPYEGKGRYVLNDWTQCCQHRALTCPANEESEEATGRFIAWLQGEGQTGDKLQVCMHLTNKLGENLKRQRVDGGRRKSRRRQSRRRKSRRRKSRRRKSRRRKSRRRRSSNRNRLTCSRC